ncbi:MAG: hypothetical protein LLF98_02240 [Clostridium sp.]|uniref:hypothetical protein n=1 Tax=Clostridium sp. TaxID=1506 RepID=UPI0025B9C17E|nr:hypothetical protein [Clostridium sp.]MCE5220101.1 hypothetical protein [Clostridium sp.]
MMMRPRNYSVLNRSIARGLTYALRDNNRKKYTSNKNTHLNSKQNINPVTNTIANIVVGIIAFWFLVFILSI